MSSGAGVLTATCRRPTWPFWTPTGWFPWFNRSLNKAAEKKPCVIVGRGAPYFLRERTDIFSVFLYASRELKYRRILKRVGSNEKEAVRIGGHHGRGPPEVRETLLRPRMAQPPTLPCHAQHRHRRRQHRGDNSSSAECRQSKRGGSQNMKPAIVMRRHACLALLAGCAVGPDYQPPKANAPSHNGHRPSPVAKPTARLTLPRGGRISATPIWIRS